MAIPAGAGESTFRKFAGSSKSGYPRRRGGIEPLALSPTPILALSPQARGNRGTGRIRPVPHLAIPAGAGESRLAEFGYPLLCAAIPAGAGESPTANLPKVTSKVYPRKRGGTVVCYWANLHDSGLSPQTRGNLSNIYSVPRMEQLNAC